MAINVDLSYENHLEIQLVKNKEEKPKSNYGFLIPLILLLPFIITLAASISPIPELEGVDVAPFGGDFNQFSAQTPNAEGQTPLEFSAQAPNAEGQTPLEEELNSNQEITPFIPENSVSVRINSCNGVNYAGANFRDEPALTPLTIRGVVREGEWVTLTGKTFWDGQINWYEATNNSVLSNSNELNAQNQTYANQIGWIAACFIE
jgi:hypothetical protein